MPMALDRARPADRGRHYLEVITRLKPNVSIKQAAADVESLANAIQAEAPTVYPADSGWGFSLVSMQEQITGKVRPALLVLWGAAGFVLLIACANLANLLLARATVREKEIALRAALGASRKRLIKQLLTESLLLSLAGGAVGLLFAYVCVKLFKAISPSDIPRLDEIGIDANVLGFCLAVSLLTGVGFGLAPAIYSARLDLNNSLKESGRGSTDNRHFTLNLFVVSEIALALVLLISSGLMIKSFIRLLDVDLGFRTESILTTRISIPPARYREIPQVRAFFNQVTEKIKELPGVVSVGGISQLPLSNTHASGTIAAEDTSAGEGLRRFHGHPYLEADQRSVTPDYFTSLGIPLIKGRYITEADGDRAPAVVVVDEKFVRAFWPDGDAVGKRVALGEDPDHITWAEIVGVVGHVRHEGLEQPGREQVYFPFTQRPNHSLFITIHTTLDPLTITNLVRQKVLSIDSDQPIYLVRTMEQLLTASVAQRRLNVVLLSIFAGVALVLAAVGIYGVTSYIVTRRTQEIGIRMALGAQPKDILKLFIRKGMLITVTGIILGLFAAFFMTRLIASLLFEVRTWDPILFTLIAVLIAGVALLASYIPVRRATKVDPMTALRFE
jgi:putative ABC transport system permease protein